MLNFKEGDAIVAPDGRIGMVSEIFATTIMCQFGAGGPFGRYSPRSLRWVTEDEVKRAGMHGTGFNVLSEEDKIARASEQRKREHHTYVFEKD